MAARQSAAPAAPAADKAYDPEIQDMASYIHQYKIDSDLAVSNQSSHSESASYDEESELGKKRKLQSCPVEFAGLTNVERIEIRSLTPPAWCSWTPSAAVWRH